ncbi:hypothetical protein BJV74DRAFT_502503 [Russula compacta]|nr:hypothetical protein BJV74DRAFT_502503 [Russula compacta]
MRNTSPEMPVVPSTSQHDSEAPFDDRPLSQDSSPQLQSTAILEPDLIGSASLDSGSSTLLPLAGPSSLNVAMPDPNKASGSKRKPEDDGDASEAEAKSHDKKKLKLEKLDGGASSFFIIPMSDVTAAESLANELGRPGSLSYEQPEHALARSEPDSSESALTLPDVPSSLPTVSVDLPASFTPPLRPHSAPPASPVIANVTAGAHPLPPPSTLPPDPEPLHTYSCPICFSSPTNATLTPCGHIMCGECLFTAVGAATVRMGIAALAARYVKKCPVCRATIPRWDGKGGGVIGLQPRVVITI